FGLTALAVGALAVALFFHILLQSRELVCSQWPGIVGDGCRWVQGAIGPVFSGPPEEGGRRGEQPRAETAGTPATAESETGQLHQEERGASLAPPKDHASSRQVAFVMLQTLLRSL